jgi:NADH-quinone oxidoreductase subunit F
LESGKPKMDKQAVPQMGPRIYKYIAHPNQHRLETYLEHGGYQALRKALNMPREELVAWVNEANIRGRGGAGFPLGRKWGTIPKGATTIYLACNADESEPGTCKDREILENDPHQLIEAMAIYAYAVGIRQAYIYIRGEFRLAAERLEAAIREAREHGFLGRNILGREDFSLDIWVHRGAGAYICGEETALIESLGGKRGQPRLRPPYYPTVMGLLNRPTPVNNVETIVNLVHLVNLGVEAYKSVGTSTSPGTKLYPVSGHVKRPGVYEAPFSVTLRQLIYDYAGGIRNGNRLKAVIPGGASVRWLTEKDLDVVMDFDSVRAAGSDLGSAGIMVMDETVCAVDAALNLVHFFAHESCGKCTPCREGTRWMEQILWRIQHGEGRPGDIELLEDVASNIGGKSFCLLGDSSVVPVQSSIALFRDEYERHIAEKRCPVAQEFPLSSPEPPH